jgi:DNA-binding cell septation regulator SpoVG
MRIVRFAPATTGGPAVAYLCIETPSGLVLNSVKLMRGQNGTHWLGMPSQKRVDRDGKPVIGDNGRQKYGEFVGFRDRQARDRFTAAVLDVVRREHPEALR